MFDLYFFIYLYKSRIFVTILLLNSDFHMESRLSRGEEAFENPRPRLKALTILFTYIFKRCVPVNSVCFSLPVDLRRQDRMNIRILAEADCSPCQIINRMKLL